MRASACLLVLLLAVLAYSLPVSARLHHRVGVRGPPAARRVGSPLVNPRPIIGIFTLANSDAANETGSMVPAGYVKWLEQGGARTAPIPFNAPKAELDRLFAGINGLLFTGGGLTLAKDSLFFNQALYLFEKAKAANDAGDVFPIWGSCQGFQLMHLLAATPDNHADVLKCLKYDSENLPLALNFTDKAATSQLFSPARNLPALVDGSSSLTIFDAFATLNITMNLHNCGVDPADFAANPILPKFYDILSTNVDKKGLPFVSSIEGQKYPFWATQWHAERTQFEWDSDELLAHTAIGVSTHSYVSQRWMMLARQSAHRFPDDASEQAALFYNYLPSDTRIDPLDAFQDVQVYRFTFDYNEAQ